MGTVYWYRLKSPAKRARYQFNLAVSRRRGSSVFCKRLFLSTHLGAQLANRKEQIAEGERVPDAHGV